MPAQGDAASRGGSERHHSMEADMTEVIDREGVVQAPNGANADAPLNGANGHDAGASFPSSNRVYVEGSRPDVRVPFREVTQAPTRTAAGIIDNAPLRVYD